MFFPTTSTFIIQGMMPGHTIISFSPCKEKQKVVKILHNGQDILKSGIDTKPGEEIKDITDHDRPGPSEGSAGSRRTARRQDSSKHRPSTQVATKSHLCRRIAYGRHCTNEKGLADNRRKSLCSKVAEAGIEPARPVTGTGF